MCNGEAPGNAQGEPTQCNARCIVGEGFSARVGLW